MNRNPSVHLTAEVRARAKLSRELERATPVVLPKGKRQREARCLTMERIEARLDRLGRSVIDLRDVAKSRRWVWRFEESYYAERPEFREDEAPWLVEIPCKHGFIYPYGGDQLVAWTKSYPAKTKLEALEVVHRQQTEGTHQVTWACAYRFPADLLDEVAGILRPKRLRGRLLTPEERTAGAARLRESRERKRALKNTDLNDLQTHQERTEEPGTTSRPS